MSTTRSPRSRLRSHSGSAASSSRRFPNGTFDPDPDDDRFWSLVAESGLPAAIHLGSFIRPRVDTFPEMRGATIMALAGMSKGGSSAIEMSCNLIFSGIFERVPALKVVLVESGIGWIPSLLEQLDDMFLRYRWATEFAGQMQALPSELFRRNVWATFITDRVGLENTPPDERRARDVVDRLPARHVLTGRTPRVDRAAVPRRSPSTRCGRWSTRTRSISTSSTSDR